MIVSSREVAVIKHGSKSYAVRVRSRFLGFLWWKNWKSVWYQDKTWYWPYKEARSLADQVVVNGYIPSGLWNYPNQVYPIIELDYNVEV